MDLNRFYKLSGLIIEDFKTQNIKYQQQGYDNDIVNNYLVDFATIKDKKFKELYSDKIRINVPIERRQDVDSYRNFQDLKTIVDYVKSQVNINKEEIQTESSLPIYEDNNLSIFYGDSPNSCIKIKGKENVNWCVSSISSNAYNTYRYNSMSYNPTFYFVKSKKKKISNKFYFFVIQVLNFAKINDIDTQQYKVTSIKNDGEIKMSWNEILKIEPNLNGLQNLFKPIPLSEEEKNFFEKYRNFRQIDDEEYCGYEYNLKKKIIEVFTVTGLRLNDVKFLCTPDNLKNEYIGFYSPLTFDQFDIIKHNKNLINRYHEITNRILKERETALKDSQILMLTPTQIKKLGDVTITQLIWSSSDKNKTINIILNSKKKNLTKDNKITILNNSDDPDSILKNMGNNVFNDFNGDDVFAFLLENENMKNVIKLLGKEKLTRLSTDNLFRLLKRQDYLDLFQNVTNNMLYRMDKSQLAILSRLHGLDAFKNLIIRKRNEFNEDDIIDLAIHEKNATFILTYFDLTNTNDELIEKLKKVAGVNLSLTELFST